MLLSGRNPSRPRKRIRIGLVNAVVPQAELLSFSRAWLQKVVANGPLALGLVIEVVDAGLDAGLEEVCGWKPPHLGVGAASEDLSRRRPCVPREEGVRPSRESETCREYLKGSFRPAACDSPYRQAASTLHYRAPARRRHGRAHPAPAPTGLIDVIKVPGSWEVPLVAGEVARQHRYDAVICLSADDSRRNPALRYVAAEAAKGIATWRRNRSAGSVRAC